MSVDIEPSEAEKKIHSVMQGYVSTPAEMRSFAFPDRELDRGEVIGRFQLGLDLFTEVRRSRAVYEAAVEKQKAAVPGMKQFHADAIKVARLHFGADPKKMASFGVACPTRGKRRRSACQSSEVDEVVTTVVEEVITTREEVPCERQSPKTPCRAKKVPGRGPKRGCEEAKRCSGRATRQAK